MNYTIERGVPIPPVVHNYAARTPVTRALATLEVGESFKVTTILENEQARSRMTRIPGKKFSIRKVDDGWRIWRTE